MKNFAPIILRVGLSLVFLWFGIEQVLNTEAWSGLIPEWISSVSGFTPASLVFFNGIFEIVLGLMLFLGVFTRIAALLLALHLFHITVIVGYNDVGVRDFGLAMAALAIFFNGTDTWCLERFLKRQNKVEVKNL